MEKEPQNIICPNCNTLLPKRDINYHRAHNCQKSRDVDLLTQQSYQPFNASKGVSFDGDKKQATCFDESVDKEKNLFEEKKRDYLKEYSTKQKSGQSNGLGFTKSIIIPNQKESLAYYDQKIYDQNEKFRAQNALRKANDKNYQKLNADLKRNRQAIDTGYVMKQARHPARRQNPNNPELYKLPYNKDYQKRYQHPQYKNQIGNVACRQAMAAQGHVKRAQEGLKKNKQKKEKNSFAKLQQQTMPVSKTNSYAEKVECEKCNKKIPIELLNQHEIECSMSIKCQYCQQQHPVMLIQEHQKVCEIKSMLLKQQKKSKENNRSKHSYKTNNKGVRIGGGTNSKFPYQKYEDLEYENYLQELQNKEYADALINPQDYIEVQDQQIQAQFLMGDNQGFIDQQHHFQLPQEKPKQKGLSKSNMNRIPRKGYNLLVKNKAEGEQIPEDCSICYSSFNKLDRVMLLKCKHIFHPDCLVEWLKSDSRCPMCKEKVQV